jgi:hypothetical protein
VDAVKKVGLEETEKTKYMLSRRQHAEQNRNVKTANMSFELGAKLKYLGNIVRNKILLMRKLKLHCFRVMLATIQFRIFFLLV